MIKIARYLVIPFWIIIAINLSLSQWEQVGFNNDLIPALTTANDVILAGNDTVIYQSYDFGLTWDTLAVINSPFIYVLKYIDGILFSGNARGIIGNPYLSTCIFRSIDNGLNWNSVYASVFGTTEIEGHRNSIFANADGKLIRSMDNGLSWMIIQTIPESNVSIASNDNYVFASVDGDSLYRSADFGSTWTSVENGLPTDTKWSTVAKDDTILTISSDSIYLSVDNGDNWINITNGFPINLIPSGLFIIDDYIFCPTMLDNQIYVTTISNINWRNFSEGIMVTGFADIYIIVRCDNYLFAGTSNGVWRRPLSQLVYIKEPETRSKIEDFNLYQNYPNPFNPTTTIKYNLPQSSVILIQIFNSLGEKVKTLYSGLQTSGTHEIVFDGSSLPSGIYFYQLTTKDFSQTKKCLLLK